MDLGIPEIGDAVEIGSGGSATVYRARQEHLGRDVAVKVLTVRLSENSLDERRRFQREQLALGRLSDLPGVIPVYTSGLTPENQPYLIMPFYQNGSLQDRLDDEGPLPVREAAELMVAVSVAVGRAHRDGIFHRDIKPGNIMISREGEPMIGDFGVARLVDSTTLFHSRTIATTPAYSAPEVFMGADPTAVCDVYALGATLYALLSGAPAFVSLTGEGNVLALMRRIETEPVPDLRARGIPDELATAVEQAMAKAPEDRPSSAAEFARRLQEIAASLPVEEQAPLPPPPGVIEAEPQSEPAPGPPQPAVGHQPEPTPSSPSTDQQPQPEPSSTPPSPSTDEQPQPESSSTPPSPSTDEQPQPEPGPPSNHRQPQPEPGPPSTDEQPQPEPRPPSNHRQPQPESSSTPPLPSTDQQPQPESSSTPPPPSTDEQPQPEPSSTPPPPSTDEQPQPEPVHTPPSDLEAEGELTPTPPRPDPKRNWQFMGTAAAILLLVGGGIWVAGRNSGDDPADATLPPEIETEATAESSDDGTDDGQSDGGEEDEGDSPAPAADAGSGGELRLLQWQAPSQANSMLSSGTKDLLAASLVLEPLARFAPDGSLVPVLAAEIPTVDNGGVADDFTSITWHLRDDVIWSDGTPFTSDDVVFSWEYCSDQLTGCSADFTTVADVSALDDYTVRVQFTDSQPFPYNDFVGYTENIIQRAQFQDCIGERASACTDQNFAPIGTGPFMITDLKPEDTVTYVFNPLYRGVPEGRPFFGSVTLKGGGDAESTARSVLAIGEADYAWNLQVAPEILTPMEAAGNGRLVTSFAANVEHINLNQTDPEGNPPSEYSPNGSGNHPILFANFPLAQALSLAIDREALVQVGYGAAGSPVCTLWPAGSQRSTTHDWCLTHDLDQANAILDELGYVDTDGDGIRESTDGRPLDFDFVTSTNAVRQTNQEIIKANWQEIGVDVDMRNEDASLFFDGTSASDASIWKFFSDMEMFTNGSTSPDPIGYLQGWRIEEIPTAALGWPASGNLPRMQSPEFDALWLETSQLDPTDPAHIANVQRLQDLMIESGAVIPLIHRGNVSAISNSIDGFGEPNGWDSEYWNIQDWFRR